MKFTQQLLFAAFLIVAATSCQDEEKAKLVIRLTDSPGDYDAVTIDIQGI